MTDNQIDFVALKQRFDEKLTPGQRAEIRRIAGIEELSYIPAIYHLTYQSSEKMSPGLLQTIYFLPYVDHSENAASLGEQLVKARINETRIFQVVRSEAPQDLYYLRRIFQQVKPTANWADLGKLLFFWRGEYSKKKLLEDYFTAQYQSRKSKKGETNA